MKSTDEVLSLRPEKNPKILDEIQDLLPPHIKVPFLYFFSLEIFVLLVCVGTQEIMAKPLDTPEQIAAYIAARKKSYPSRLNVQSKEQNVQEQEQRGQLPATAVRRFQDTGSRRIKPTIGKPISVLDALAGYDDESDSDSISDGDTPPAEESSKVVPNAHAGAPSSSARCKYFATAKGCKNGTSCRFSHVFNDVVCDRWTFPAYILFFQIIMFARLWCRVPTKQNPLRYASRNPRLLCCVRYFHQRCTENSVQHFNAFDTLLKMTCCNKNHRCKD